MSGSIEDSGGDQTAQIPFLPRCWICYVFVVQLVAQWRRQDLVPGGTHAKVTGFLEEATVDI